MKLFPVLKLTVRGLVAGVTVAAATTTWSQTFPSKTIKIVVTTGAGTASDATARYLAEGMSKALNTPVIVENKVGASGVIATDSVAKAVPDGHTVLLTFSSHYINHWTMKPPYDALADFEPIARLNRSPLIFTTSPTSPYTSLRDLIAAAKQNPDKVSSATAGGVTQMAGALMASMAGIRMNEVLYKEPSRVLIEASSSLTDVAISGLTAAVPMIEGGRVRALAISTATRSSRVPDVPTVAEAGLTGYEMSSTTMILAPKGTPPAVVSRLSSVITTLAAAEGAQKLCVVQACDLAVQDAATLKAAGPAELEKWHRIVQLIN
jgi:tripartite-type tricarboxylate transporter receptor subunit TctC